MRKSNTLTTVSGAEIYENEIYRLTDEFIETELDGDSQELMNGAFPLLISYLSARLPDIPNENIELMDKVFDCYVKLCLKYKRLPTIELFANLIKVHRSTLYDWGKEYRLSSKHADTVQKWRDICTGYMIDRLHNKPGTDANLIFVAKSCHGLVETAPAAPAEQPRQRVLTAAELPKLKDFTELEGENARD